MQFWPRKRSSRSYANIKAYRPVSEAKLLGFAGYKVGMTHAMVIDNTPNSKTKNQQISIPLTVIETPPLKIFSVRFYKTAPYGKYVSTEVMNPKLGKELSRTITAPKKDQGQKLAEIEQKLDQYSEVRVLVYTSPKLVKSLGKKKPEVFETQIGGNIQEQFAWVKENLSKEISVNDVISEGMNLDIHAVTKGKGYQGPVKRFGVGLTHHKSEKTRRGPGSLGGWKGQGHFMYRVPYAGQTGYFKRVDYNKMAIKIGDNPDEINVEGDYKRYGKVTGNYMLIKGSIPGSVKRLIRFIPSTRNTKDANAPQIVSISQSSVQG